MRGTAYTKVLDVAEDLIGVGVGVERGYALVLDILHPERLVRCRISNRNRYIRVNPRTRRGFVRGVCPAVNECGCGCRDRRDGDAEDEQKASW